MTATTLFALDEQPVWLVIFDPGGRVYTYVCSADELVERVLTGRHAPDQQPPEEIWVVREAIRVTPEMLGLGK